jgi:DNA-binding MarR family transcriptional regulator
MLFRQVTLQGVADGRIKRAFRRWKRPTVKAGGTLKTRAGLLGIDSVERIAESSITERSATAAGFQSRAALLAELEGRAGELYEIRFHRIGDDPRIALRKNARLSTADIVDLQQRLARLDAHSSRGPWTMQVLRLIEKHPERRAVELAQLMDYDKSSFKTNVRKLKNLGLTESLDVGYRLSPRGRALLKATAGTTRQRGTST